MKCFPADVKDKHLKKIDDFVWVLDEVPLTGQLIIEVEFTDLKTASSDVNAILSHSIFKNST